MLVVTPKPLVAESLMGYLLHLTEVNAYPSTSYIISTLNGRWYGSTVGRLDAAPLAELARLEPTALARLTMLPDGLPRAFVRVFGNDLPSYEVSSRTPKVCPQCLKEGSRCEAFWDLTQAVACPRHGVGLISTCPKCTKLLSWSRKKVTECKCGSDLTTWPTEAVTPQVRGLMELMRYLTYRGEAQTSPPEGWRHLTHLTLRQLCKMMWVLAYVVRETSPNPARTKARRNYRQELDHVAKMLSDWPHNFRAFLEVRYSDLVCESKPLPSFNRPFSWVCNGLISNVEDGAIAFQFLGDEVFRFAARHWTRSSIRKDLRLTASTETTFRWGTHSEACELLGLHMNTLKKLIDAGEISTKRIAGRGSRSIVIDLEHACSLRQSQYPAISIRDAAKQVGVSIETLKAMCDSGLYERTYRPSFPGSLTVEDVGHLSTRMGRLFDGKKQVRGEAFISIDQAFCTFGTSAIEKAAVFRWLLENPALVVGRLAKGLGLGRLQVESSAVDAFLVGIRDQDSCVTLRFAARQLGCSDATITALKRAGHLDCKKVRGRVHPRKASLAQFHSDYESMTHLARRTGVPIQRIYARVDLSKFRNVRVRSVQYSTVFVWRADVAKAEGLIRNARRRP